MKMQWNLEEMSLQELGSHSFDSLSARYRGAQPIAIISRLIHLDGYAVLNIFAPLNFAFRACTQYRLIRSCFDSLDSIAENNDACTAFKKDLRAARITISSPQLRWLDQLDSRIGASKKRVPSLSSYPSPYLEIWRWQSLAVPIRFVGDVINFLNEEVAQFAEQAFLRVAEDVSLLDPPGAPNVGYYLFATINQRFHPPGPEREAFKQQVLIELRAVVRSIEMRGAFDTPIEPVWQIKDIVSFVVFDSELGDPVTLEILSNRARLVRLLGWPGHFHSVYASIQNSLLAFSGMPQIKLPYDIRSELTQYLEQAKTRYPVLIRPVFRDENNNAERSQTITS